MGKPTRAGLRHPRIEKQGWLQHLSLQDVGVRKARLQRNCRKRMGNPARFFLDIRARAKYRHKTGHIE